MNSLIHNINIRLYQRGTDVIAEVQDDTFSSGDIGLIVGTWEDSNFTVAFDDLYITAP